MPEEEKPTFGKYQVVELLGEGGMGRVWRAFDPDLEVPVAIKELKEQFRDANNLERFYREAQIAAKCRHQNIVLITDLSKDPPYFAMEFLEAQELSVYVHKGKPLSLDRMVHILGQVCDGLGFLHKRGIFHRDLKPANVMLLEDDTVKITDFGISKAPFGQKTMTQVIMGTIPYMSPEQITTPGSVDSRVDIWALGVILFELTQRKHPFPGEGDINTIFHIVHSDHAAFGTMPPEVDGPLREIIGRALKKNPEERIKSTKEFKALLRGLLNAAGEPEEIVFPFQPPTDSTVVLSAKDIPSAVDPALVEKAESLIKEIESLPDVIRSVIEHDTYKKAAERAELSRKVLEEGDPVGIESAVRSLESQKAAIHQAIQAGFDRLVSRAETALGKGREAEAAALFRQVAQGDPSRAEAVDGFDRAIQALLVRGRRNQGQGNLTGAVDAWKEVLKWQPDHAEARRLVDEAAGEREAREKAEAALALARRALEEERPEEAQEAVRPILSAHPDHPEAREIRDRAREMIEKATRSLQADQLRTEGRRFLEAGDLDRARISFTTLLEMVPGDDECREALKTIEAAQEQERQAAEARELAARAEQALQSSEFDKAVDLFKRALSGLPDDKEVAGRLQTAQRRLDALLNAESEAGQREKAGDLKGAVQVWEQVLKLQPGHAAAPSEISRLRGLLEKIEAAKAAEKREEEEARRRAAEAIWQEHAVLAERFRAIPEMEHPQLGADAARKAAAALAQMEAARARADQAALRDGAKALEREIGRLEARRRDILAKMGPEVEKAAAAVEAALDPVAGQLRDAVVRGAREAVARARKDAGGPAVHPLEGHVTGLKRIRDGIHKEIQGALAAARDRMSRERQLLAAAASKNGRAVVRRPELKARIDSLLRQASAARTSGTLQSLESLGRSMAQARGQIPTDLLRFLPHMIAAAALVAAAGGYAGWRLIQSGTEHPYLLRVAPWGSVVSIEGEDGRTVAPPPGESPFHSLELLPGSWTITVENSTTGARETITATIPEDSAGEVALEGPDYGEGLRELMSADPWFGGEGGS